MASDNTANVVLKFHADGAIEMAKTVKELNSIMNVAAKEYRAQVSAMDSAASSTSALEAKQRKLETQSQAAEQRTKLLVSQFNDLKNSGNASSAELTKMQGKVYDAQRAENSLKNQLKDVNTQLSEHGKESLSAKDKLGDLENQESQLRSKQELLTSGFKLENTAMGENASKSTQLKTAQSQLESQLKVSREVVANLEQQLKATESAYGKNSTEAMQMGAKLNAAKTDVAGLENKLGSLGEKTKTSAGALGTFKEKLSFGAVAGAAANAVQNVVGGIGDLVSQAAGASDSIQKFESTMKFAGFGKASIDKATKSMKDYADKTVYDLETVSSTTAQLASNGVPHFTELTQAAGNLNAVAGGNADTFKSVGMVLTQTAGAGKLTTENWNQLADAIPGASGKLQTAMKQNGAYTGNFRDAMAKGQITAGEFNKAIMQLGMEDAAKKAATSTSTFEGAIGSLQANVVTGIQKVIDSIGKENLTGIIATVSNGVVGAFRTLANVVQEISAHATGFKVLAAAVLGLFAAFKGAQAIVAVVTTFTTLKTIIGGSTAAMKLFNLAMAAGPIGLVVTAVAALTAGLVYFFTSTTKGKAMWSGFISWLKSAWQGVSSFFTGLWSGIKNVFSTSIDAIGNFLKKWGTTILAVLGGPLGILVKLIVDHWDQIKAKTMEIWNGLVGVIKGVLTTIGNVVKVGLMLVQSIFQGAWTVISSLTQAAWNILVAVMKTVWQPVADFFKNLWDGVKNVFSSVWNSIKDVISPIIQGIVDYIKNTWNQNIENIKSMLNALKNFFSTIWNAISSTVKSIVSALATALKPIWDGISNTVKAAWNAIKTFTSSIWNGIKSSLTSIAKAIGSALKAAWDSVKSVAKAAWTSVKNTASSIWNSIKSSVSSIAKSLGSALKSAWDSVKSVASSAWSAVKSTATSKWNSIKSTVGSIAGKFGSTIKSAWSGLKGIASSVFGAVSSVVSSKMTSMKNIISNGLGVIKSFFSNLHLTFPHVALPYFHISPQGWSPSDLLHGSIPYLSVDWRANGGIFTQPTVFNTATGGLRGFGDGPEPEAALPLNEKTLGQIGKGIVASMGNNSNQPIYLNIDGRTFAQIAGPYMSDYMKQVDATKNFSYGRGGF